MDFLDGFLVGELLLKATSVEDVLFEKVERNKGMVRPYSTAQIRDRLKNAKSKLRNVDNIQLNAIEVERESNIEPQSTTTGNQVSDKDGRPTKINNAHIMSALRQVQAHLPEDLFIKLQGIIQPKSEKPTVETAPKMRQQEELVLERLLDSVEKGTNLSETLQNDLYDLGLLDIKFLLRMGDMADTGVRNLHPKLYNRLMRLKERPEEMSPSSDYGTYEPTELYENVMQQLEELSGLARPKKKSIIREYELLRDQRKLSVVDLVRLVNGGKYRFQGQQTKKDFNRLAEKINDTLKGSWDKTIDRFIRDLEIKDDAGEVVRVDREWSTAKLDDELISEWERIKDDPDINYESVKGKKYLKEIYKLEEEYSRLSNQFKAANTLIEMLKEKVFISDDISYDFDAKEKEFREQYKLIQQNIENYNKYKKTMQTQLKEKSQKQEQLRRRLQRDKNKPEENPRTMEDTPDVDEHMAQLEAARKKKEPVRMTPGMNIDELRAKVKELNERYKK